MRGKTVLVLVISALLLSASAFSYYALVYAPSLRTEARIIKLYFGTIDASQVAPEERTIPGEITGEKILQELINGPVSSELVATLPRGTKLVSFSVENGVAFVNFSHEVVDHHIGGTASELMLIYSVVASLSELPGVTAVQFMVEGAIEPALWGHVDTSSPLTLDEQFIAR